MTNLHDISANPVRSLNGDHTATTKEDDVILDKNITLSNFLCYEFDVQPYIRLTINF